MAKNPPQHVVLRPFAGLPNEPDWVAMREIIPSATARVVTTAQYGSREVTVVTALPGGYTAMHRPDGSVLLALQGALSSGDLSHDLAVTLLAAIDAEPGTAFPVMPSDGSAVRLQDVLDVNAPFDLQVQQGYDYWLDATAERSEEVEQSLREAAETSVPTVAVAGVEHAFWCQMSKEFVRWVRSEDEDAVVDAIARLHATRDSALQCPGGQGRFLGMFRAAGLVVPVWELPQGTTAADVAGPLKELESRLDAALAVTEPLTANERRARAGIVSRQVTLR